MYILTLLSCLASLISIARAAPFSSKELAIRTENQAGISKRDTNVVVGWDAKFKKDPAFANQQLISGTTCPGLAVAWEGHNLIYIDDMYQFLKPDVWIASYDIGTGGAGCGRCWGIQHGDSHATVVVVDTSARLITAPGGYNEVVDPSNPTTTLPPPASGATFTADWATRFPTPTPKYDCWSNAPFQL
ncbi:hypothetical protein ABW21_db0202254 [Orbilia brochopaga]|nr:hypothetical protein ABW21_db0202254 [Drechslerella brochopaga]